MTTGLSMAEDRPRRLARLLRAKAASTTFPEERTALLERAAAIEKKYGITAPAPRRPSLRYVPARPPSQPGGLYMDVFRMRR